MTLTLLVAEDDATIAQAVAYGARLTWPGGRVEIAPDGAHALRLFAPCQPDLVVLDVAMPPPDGFEVCRRIRAVSTVPILMLTARDGTLDKVRALDLGADDYLTKPFDEIELLARLRALARRARLAGGTAPPLPGAARPSLVVGDAASRPASQGGRRASRLSSRTQPSCTCARLSWARGAMPSRAPPPPTRRWPCARRAGFRWGLLRWRILAERSSDKTVASA